MSIIIGEFINPIINNEPTLKSFMESVNDDDRNIAIFDFGGVLIDGDFTEALKQDPRIPNEYIEELKKAWIIEDSNFTENCTKDEYIQEVYKRTPEYLKYLISVMEEVESTYLNVLPHAYTLLNTLRNNGYELYYLSNWSKWSSEELIKHNKMDFIKLFDGGLFSYQTGYLKPNKMIYKTLLKKYNIDPNKAIFFDDNQDNIDTANNLGIKGILFTEELAHDILSDYLLNNSVDSRSNNDLFFGINHELGLQKMRQCKMESAMSAKERNELEDDDFGIPELRKYPLHDKKHVEQAVKMFNHVEKKYEVELADNILDAMERYHISTDIVGEKNRLRKYIKEETTYVAESLFEKETPNEIKKLREKLKEFLTDKSAIDDTRDVVQTVKDTIRNRDYSSHEKELIYNSCKRLGIKIFGYANTSTNIKGIETNNNHRIIGGYKNYIITIKFLGIKGVLSIPISGLKVNYDANKSDIPRGIAFDMLSILSPNVTKVKSTKRSIKVSAWSESIDSGYARLSHKYMYSGNYNVKKNPGGFSITLSTMKMTNENSLIMAAIPPTPAYDPNSVYIVNYTKKNTFVNDLAICKDKMSSIFVCDDGKPIHLSLTDFKEMATDIKVYKYEGECDFDKVVESSKCGLDFYKNLVNDNAFTLESDYRFTRVSSYIDELNSVEECIINSAPKSGIVHEVYCPIIPLVNLNISESVVHYFRDIDGVFAQNINTLSRSASYKSVEDIPESTIDLLKNI